MKTEVSSQQRKPIGLLERKKESTIHNSGGMDDNGMWCFFRAMDKNQNVKIWAVDRTIASFSWPKSKEWAERHLKKGIFLWKEIWIWIKKETTTPNEQEQTNAKDTTESRLDRLWRAGVESARQINILLIMVSRVVGSVSLGSKGRVGWEVEEIQEHEESP